MRSLIMDVDTGEDDALAILLALRLGLPLRYVFCSYGNTALENVTRNTAAILELAGASGVKVLPGAQRSSRPHIHWKKGVSAGRFVGPNGLCGVELPEPE